MQEIILIYSATDRDTKISQYIHHELMSPVLRDKTHLFNSFFYKALTQPIKKETKNDPASKRLSNSEKMHQQVID